MVDPAGLAELRAFWAEVYACFGCRRDALFEVLDAATTCGRVPSLAHLSLEGLHQRRWGSLYGALAQGTLEVAALRTAVGRHPLADGAPIYAVDTSPWPRNDAETRPERGYCSHPSRHSAGKPSVAGWSYSWLAQVGRGRPSWSAPVDVRRVHPKQNGHAVAAAQVRAVADALPAQGPVPTFLFDAGYDPVQLVTELADARAAGLVRVRRDRCCYPDPAPVPGPRPTGRPRRHGAKVACTDPSTWPSPTGEHHEADQQFGCVRGRAWAGLHAKTQEHPTRGTRRPRPSLNGTLLLVEVGRLPRPTRPVQALWLWWHAPEGGGGRTWPASGGRTFGASTWSTRSASSHRCSPGQRRGCALPSRPTAGPGSSCSRPRNSAWPAPSRPMCGGPGSRLSDRGASRQDGSAGRFRSAWYSSARQRPDRNPGGCRRGARKVPDPARPHATPPSRRPPDSVWRLRHHKTGRAPRSGPLPRA